MWTPSSPAPFEPTAAFNHGLHIGCPRPPYSRIVSVPPALPLLSRMMPERYLLLLPHNLPHFAGLLIFVFLLFGFYLLLYFHVLHEISLIFPPSIIEGLHELLPIFSVPKIHFRSMIVNQLQRLLLLVHFGLLILKLSSLC